VTKGDQKQHEGNSNLVIYIVVSSDGGGSEASWVCCMTTTSFGTVSDLYWSVSNQGQYWCEQVTYKHACIYIHRFTQLQHVICILTIWINGTNKSKKVFHFIQCFCQECKLKLYVVFYYLQQWMRSDSAQKVTAEMLTVKFTVDP